jgi:hypothetical protein
MTSQVGITNHSGVAVASDTVITAFVDGGTKSIGSSHKILELGPEHKVLVLLSGAITTNGVTNRLYVTEWASTLEAPFATLEEYVESFANWMGTDSTIHSFDSEINRANYLLNDHFYEIKYRAKARWDELDEESKQYSSQAEILISVAQEGYEYLSSLDFVPGVDTDEYFNSFLESEQFDLNGKLEFYFKDLDLSPTAESILMNSCPLILARQQFFDGGSSMAFIGFGASEFFAGNMRLRVRGFYGGKFVYSLNEYIAVSPDMASLISPFAQDQAIFGFLQGFRFAVLDHMEYLIESHVNDAIENNEGENIGREIASKVRDGVFDHFRRKITDPLLDSIEGLDLFHLANLAESLVGMEATSSFGADGPATVGGMIEVATIDRQNGVTWVRKLQDF